MIDWLFRDRRTGGYTIAQAPNLSLAIALVAIAARLAFHPHGSVRTALVVVATAALVWWALDELLRGVNPWRRLLGAGMLAVQVLALIR